jgi:hypothetical protein
MGSTLRVNDTLQITPVQGFPVDLDLARHLASPIAAADVADRIFAFSDKGGIRCFQQPPILNFLVENRDGMHVYWGLIAMIDVRHDYLANTTSGRFRIELLYLPEQMRMAGRMTGLDPALDPFSTGR